MDGHLHSYYSSLRGWGDDKTDALDLCAGPMRRADVLLMRSLNDALGESPVSQPTRRPEESKCLGPQAN